MPSVSNPIVVLSREEKDPAAPVLAMISDDATQSSSRMPLAELDRKEWENAFRLMPFAIFTKLRLPNL